MQPEHVAAGPDAHPVDRLAETQVPQDVLGVGADLDAGPNFGKRRRLLINLDSVACLHQAGRGGQAANPCPCDEDAALIHIGV